MEIEVKQSPVQPDSRCPYEWVGRVLTHFALAEQAIGRLCTGLDLPIEKGSLSSLADLRHRLIKAQNKRCSGLDAGIGRWSANRPLRHLLAHATLHRLIDGAGREVIVTRHLPRDKDDVTPDRMWTGEEREDLLKQALAESRSIADQVNNILADPQIIKQLRAA